MRRYNTYNEIDISEIVIGEMIFIADTESIYCKTEGGIIVMIVAPTMPTMLYPKLHKYPWYKRFIDYIKLLFTDLYNKINKDNTI